MQREHLTLISLLMVSMSALAAPENEVVSEVRLAPTTLEAVGPTEFATIKDGSEAIVIETLDTEEFSAFERDASEQIEPVDAVMQEALEEAAAN